MKKILFAIALVCVIFASKSEALELANRIGDWHLVSEVVTPLIPDANSEDLGRVIYRKYSRRKPVGNLTVILTEGVGVGDLRVPREIPENNSNTLMKSQTGYEILRVRNCNAIFEKHEILPDTLAISLGKTRTLTLESYSLDRSELVKLAREILK